MRWLLRILILGALVVVAVAPALAQLTLILNPDRIASASPGQTLTILATLTNLTGEDLDLNLGTFGGTIFGPGSPGLLWDDTDFVLNMPSLLPDGSAYSANLYLNVEASAPAGDYLATYEISARRQITSEPHDASAFLLATVFRGGGTTIPEPASIALFGIGMMLLAARRRSA